MPTHNLSSDFLNYLASYHLEVGAASGGSPSSAADANAAPLDAHLPSLSDLSQELGVSVASLREQLEVAKAIGLVDVRPRTGIRLLPYSFLPAVRQSLSYAIALDWDYFVAYSDLRNHLEAAYWDEAARKLSPADHTRLRLLLDRAWEKLRAPQIQIPHLEHRQLHLLIFSRLGNPFVQGLLEAYWEAYEAVGLNVFADYGYLQQVWEYHQQMVDAVCSGNFDLGYQALVKHKDLLFHRPQPVSVPDRIRLDHFE